MTNIISSKAIKIAKPHNCWGCKIKYPIGTEMMITKTPESDKILTAYWCAKCCSFFATLPIWEQNTEWEYGELIKCASYPTEEPK